jgi:hypothetical protein
VNTIEHRNGIIYLVQKGDQTFETITELTQKAAEVAKEMDPVLVCVDMTQNGHTSIGARQAGVNTARNLKFDKMAFVGASTYEKAVINLILKAVGILPRVQYFANTAEAEVWLKQK